MKYLASFHNTLKVSRYLFRALAVLLWVLVAFVSVFYIVNALHDRESEIRQEFNLNADQAQRYIQRTADVIKELKYVAGNRPMDGGEGGDTPVQRGDIAIPNFEPLYPDSDCALMSTTGVIRYSHWRGLCATGATISQRPTTSIVFFDWQRQSVYGQLRPA